MAESNAFALKSLVADNAFSDVQKLVSRAVEQEEVVYGAFVGSDNQAWAYVAPTTKNLEKVPPEAWRELGLDEAALAAAVCAALMDAGYRVEQASDGEEALARVRLRPVDLVVCDLKMPRMDGMTFYRTLIASNPALAARVIFVTGDVATIEAERFLEESGCRWLAKPFRLGDLVRTARAVMAS